MKTIQCAHPPHHHNGFVATCRLWTASGAVYALPACCHKAIVVMRRMGALDCLYDVTIYLYYTLSFMLVEHSVCHEPISFLINVFMLLA